MNLYAVLGFHAAAEFTANDNDSGVDFSLNPRAFANNQCVRSKNFAVENAINPNGALKAELPFKFTALVDDPGHLKTGDGNT